MIDFGHGSIARTSPQVRRDPGIVSILFILCIDVKTKPGTRELSGHVDILKITPSFLRKQEPGKAAATETLALFCALWIPAFAGMTEIERFDARKWSGLTLGNSI